MCQNSCFAKFCSFRIIIHVCYDSHKTFLNTRFFITGRLLCITKSQGFEIICFAQVVLRNVLVALNHIQIDNWQLDPSTNKKVYCAYILYNCVAIKVNVSNKKQQYNIKQCSTINKNISYHYL